MDTNTNESNSQSTNETNSQSTNETANQDYNPNYNQNYNNQNYNPNNMQQGNGQYSGAQYNNGQYANQQYNNSQYANGQYNNQNMNQQYGNGQYINPQYMQNQNNFGTAAPKAKAPKKPLSSKQKKGVIIGIIAVVAVIVIACLTVFLLSLRKVKVSLDEYVVAPEFEGYDTMGNANYCYFDYEEFIDDYEDEIEYSKSVKRTSDSSDSLYDIYTCKKAGYSAAECLYYVYISGSLDNSTDLSNGDTVTYTFDITDEDLEEIKEYFKCNLIFSEEGISFTVAGLTELQKVDIFADLEITYSGKSPVAEISSIENTSSNEALSQIYYDVSDEYDLENGQTITVSIDDDEVSYLAEYYGVIPTETSKEFTVEGLDAYITSLSDISDELIDKMKSQSEDELNAHAASSYSDTESLKDLTYLGCYFLTPKNKDDYWYDSTEIYIVYKVTVNQYSEDRGYNNTTTYYTYVKFYEPILLADGTYSIDLSDYSTPYDTFDVDITGENGNGSYYYYGYEDLDSLFNKCVTTNIDSYNYETTVEDIEISESEETSEDAENEETSEENSEDTEASENSEDTEAAE